MQTLEQKISAGIKRNEITIEAKQHIINNLNPKFALRPYQIEAFSRLNFVLNKDSQRKKPTQLLFHMATGSGKTLIMAGVILDLYKQGYRNFIFFVNSSSIIEKTKDNFLNSISSKYLFSETISIEGKQIKIKEVDNFEAANQEDINIVFTTIQGLHSRLNTPRENTLTYEDFEDKKIVLLSDEAHHINAETKKGKKNKGEIESILSWEGTVNKIFNSNLDNILLDFTATADLQHPEIEKKYNDKLLFDYPLKQFREDKYSKEVQVLQAELNQFERALQAVVLSQYRRKVFEKNKINIKPVILLKSKTIGESKAFFTEFVDGISNLTPAILDKIRINATNPIIERIFNYFDTQKITISNLILELKEDFSDDKCISVNSKDDSIEKQLIVNSLEDIDNEYRAIFAVDKLNEGWDVLNLFDIVRLYNTRDADHKSGKVGKTTMSEAQLIGRGARYCPFKLDDTQSLFQRKYDDDIENELRICEELYYHSAHNPRYISELNKALEQIGMKSIKTVQKNIYLKDSFKNTEMFKSGVLYLNKRRVYDRLDIIELDKSIRDKIYSKKFLTGFSSVSKVFSNDLQMISRKANQIHSIKNFPFHIKRKALNKLPFYRFNNLQKYFPNLKSVSEFLTSDKYALNINVELEGSIERIQDPSNEMILETLVKVFDEISKAIPKCSVSYKGTKEFEPKEIKHIFEKQKVLNISVNQDGDQEYGLGQTETTNKDLFIDLSAEDWYAFNDNYGTSEEKYLVKYIKQAYDFLSKIYDEIYLIRNEKHFKIYTFEEGKPFEPDFVLILKKKESRKTIIHQIFMKSKGSDRLINDDSKIKESFLLQLEKGYKLKGVYENRDYNLVGMPLYNETINKTEFDNKFKATFYKPK